MNVVDETFTRYHVTIPFMCKTGLKIGKGLEMCMAIVEVVFVNMAQHVDVYSMYIPCFFRHAEW